jgi:hypothetical protein
MNEAALIVPLSLPPDCNRVESMSKRGGVP